MKKAAVEAAFFDSFLAVCETYSSVNLLNHAVGRRNSTVMSIFHSVNEHNSTVNRIFHLVQ